MKPTTQARIDRIMNRIPPNISEGHAAGLREIIEYELREQDRDTRHACAEAVTITMSESEENKTLSTFGPDAQMALYNLSCRAHAACMNTQAV